MQRINIINVDSFLENNSIDLRAGGNEKLTEKLLMSLPIDGWTYTEGRLLVDVVDGVEIPDMSLFGEVVSIDNI